MLKKISLVESQIAFLDCGAMMKFISLVEKKAELCRIISLLRLFEDKEFENEVSSKFPIRIFHGKDDEVIHYENSLNSIRTKKMGFLLIIISKKPWPWY